MGQEQTRINQLNDVEPDKIIALFSQQAKALHSKVDETRDAYLGFIFPINRADLQALSAIFGFRPETERSLFREARRFSSFKPGGRGGEVTNHIVGASLLALRGKSLDSGLRSVTDKNLAALVKEHEQTVLDIADARSSWFGRIYFPTLAFENAIAVFGGKVSADAIYDVAKSYGFAAEAGKRRTVRGDFGIAVWLTLLGLAP